MKLSGTRIVSILCLAILAFASLVVHAGYGTTPGPVVLVTPDNVTVNAGDVFNVSVVIENLAVNDGMAGGEFQLTWNSTVLKALNFFEVLFHEITPQSEWDNIWQLALTFNNTVGIASYACTWMDRTRAIDEGYWPADGISGNHTLAIITMEAVGTGSTSLQLPYALMCDQIPKPLIEFGDAVDMDSSGNVYPAVPPIPTNGNVTGVLDNSTGGGPFVGTSGAIPMPEFGDMPLMILALLATISGASVVLNARWKRARRNRCE